MELLISLNAVVFALRFIFYLLPHTRYAGGVVPTVAKLTTQPIGLVKALPGAAVKSLYSQHDEYYVSQSNIHTRMNDSPFGFGSLSIYT